MRYCYTILLLLILTACRHDRSPAPLEFTAWEGNPVLSPGEPGSWDELFVWTPQIIHHENVFYLFYLGGNVSGRMSIGLATSMDGFHYSKFENNPVLSPDDRGFDAFTVGPGIILKDGSTWLMYYNAQDMIAFLPGRSTGRATASSPGGPWIKSETPVISSGDLGEWDSGFLIPCSVLLLEDGSYMMFYTGGTELASFNDFFIGMATSEDGISWEKYDDPLTAEHPFAESDPVLRSGSPGKWDGALVWMANVTAYQGGFRMYYSGSRENMRVEFKSIGYASSEDGIHWEKYPSNPIYHSIDDPFITSDGKIGYLENPSLLYSDSVCFMYYECGPFKVESSYIGLATARVP
jgi:sucrose-6-phosphate hydrolase SacC (GH32 family)